MYHKSVITSWITAACLCLTTVIAAVMQHNFTYRVLVSVISYLGVYAISLYLSKNNSAEKIILTLVNILAAVLLLATVYTAVTKYQGIVSIVVVLISVIGAVSGVMAIWYNNKFQKVN